MNSGEDNSDHPANGPRKHIVITGTGRCGTTFLVQLLTNLGLQTGFEPGNFGTQLNEIARAGLEHDIRSDDCPYIVKSPWFCDYADEILQRDDILIERVIIPMRDLFEAAESRRQVYRDNDRQLSFWQKLTREIRYKLRPSSIPAADYAGGIVHTRSLKTGEQERVLLQQFYDLMLALSAAEIPVTLINYPALTEKARYLYEKLHPILAEISFERFEEVYQATLRKELVHSYPH